MSKKFDGSLNYIDPSFLITENGNAKLESFFLGLGAVFNDLKGLILFEKLVRDNYDLPTNEASCHLGNYSGVMVQIQKLMVSTIHEFFELLTKNDDVFTSKEFKSILEKLSESDKRFWNALVVAARGELPTAENLLKAIVKIRSNLAFHYDHSGKILRRAFISRFFGETKDSRNKFAYYSIGENIELTRFYFSDAAIEEALFIAAGKEAGKEIAGDIGLEKYKEQVREMIDVVSITILKLLKIYIQYRRNPQNRI